VARISGSFTTSDKTVSWSATCNIGGIPVGYSYIDGTVRHYFVNQEYVYPGSSDPRRRCSGARPGAVRSRGSAPRPEQPGGPCRPGTRAR
jgi:hypothetical protein